MITITHEEYRALAKATLDTIGKQVYFDESIAITYGDRVLLFTQTTIVFRDGSDNIYDLVPVWWELHTYQDGIEKVNDFTFGVLMQYIATEMESIKKSEV